MSKEIRGLRIEQKFRQMNAFPKAVAELNKLLENPDVSVAAVEHTIRMEPVLVQKVLRMVNSPFFGPGTNIDSLPKAVIFLGFKNLRNLVILETLKIQFRIKSLDEDHISLWSHSAATAAFAQMILQRIYSRQGEDIFLTGIIHNLGKIAAFQAEPEAVDQVYAQMNSERDLDWEVAESEILGISCSSLLLEKLRSWNFPESILAPIDKYSLRDFSETDVQIFAVSKYLAAKNGFSEFRKLLPSLPEIVQNFLQEKELELRVIQNDFPSIMEKAKELYTT